MTTQTVHTELAPPAIGPYRQAVLAGGTLYVSGQIPLDPTTGEVVKGDVADQAKRVLENLRAIVDAAGGDLRDVVKVTIYLTDMQQFAAVNAVYGSYFTAPYPARACVEVSALPKGVDVEMDAIAIIG